MTDTSPQNPESPRSSGKKVKIRLVGLDGNAFVILGAWVKAARQQGWTEEEREVVLKKATAGDYDNLLNVILEHTEDPYVGDVPE